MRLSSGLFVLFLAALPARAQEPASQGLTERIEAPARNWVNFRMGGSTQSLYPQICLEVTPPGVTGALRALMPIGWGFELVGEVSVGAASFESAPELVRPQSPWQLLVGFTVGAGF